MELEAVTQLRKLMVLKELLLEFKIQDNQVDTVQAELMLRSAREAAKELVDNFQGYGLSSDSEEPMCIEEIDNRANFLEDGVLDFINNEIASNWTSVINEIFLNE